MKISFSAKTDVGNVRKENQDSYGILADKNLFVVCDGMGGGAAGDFASRCAVDTILKSFELLEKKDIIAVMGETVHNLPEDILRVFVSIRIANRALFKFSESYVKLAGMGTTVAAVIFDDKAGVLHIYHVGDSRVYLFRNGNLKLLTKDHSKVAELVEQGKMKEDDIKTAEIQSMITRALGIHSQVKIDYKTESLRPGDYIIVCSDGLVSELDDKQIEQTIRTDTGSIEKICQNLIDSANNAGGRDNDTVVVLKFSGVADGTKSAKDTISESGKVATVREETPEQTAAEDRILRTIIDASGIKVPESAKEKGIASNPLYLGVVLTVLALGITFFAARLSIHKPHAQLAGLTGKVSGVSISLQRPSDEQLAVFRNAEDKVQKIQIIQEWYNSRNGTIPLRNAVIAIYQEGREKFKGSTLDAPMEVPLKQGVCTIEVSYNNYKIVTRNYEMEGSINVPVEKAEAFMPVMLIMVPAEL